MSDLLDREAELGALRAVLARAERGGGAAAFLEAEAGMGKSALLAEVARLAEDAGFCVLRAVGSQREQQFAYGAVRQLFEQRLHRAGTGERARLLEGAAALAEHVLGGARPAAGPDPGFGIRHGVFWLTAHLAERAPVAILVDDAQWADLSSLRWLVHLLHRLDGLPVAVVVAWRLGERGDADPLRRALLDEGAEVIVPSALGVEAVRRLAATRMGAPADERFAAACRSSTGGNPFLLTELLHLLSARGVRPVASAAAQVPEAAPAQVRRRLEARLEALGEAPLSVAEASAVLEPAAHVRHVAALTGLEPDAVEAAADALTAAHLLEDGRPLRFVHPLVRQTIYEAVPLGRRRVWHRRCAGLLADEQPVAGHLLACEPADDAWVVERLLEEGRSALAAGAPDAARPVLERALAEPAGDLRGQVRLELGRCARLLGDPDAGDVLRQALRELGPDQRTAARLELAVTLSFAGRAAEAVTVIDEAIATAGGDERRRLQALRAGVALTEDDLAAAAGAELEQLAATAPGTGFVDSCLLATAAAHRTLVAAGTAERAVEFAVRALSGPGLRTEDARDTVVYGWAARALMWADAGERARPHVDWALDDAARRGWRFGVMVGAAWRAWLALWAGDLAAAGADASRAVETGGPDYGLHFAIAALVLVEVERGDAGAAERVLDDHGLLTADPGATSTGQLLRLARARQALAAREPERALADARAMAVGATRRGGIALGLRPVMARAHAATGDEDAARRMLDDEIAAAGRWGAAGHVGVALRTQAELGLGGDAAAAVAALRRSPRRLELARALLFEGSQTRRARRAVDAREPLREALSLATGCHAAALAGEVHDELRATGARPRRPALSGVGALTPSELRVARLAAEGLSNPQIAQTLFVTTATVEKHLTATFRKLDVSRREELGAVVR